MTRLHRMTPSLLGLMLVAALATGITACGSSNDEKDSASSGGAKSTKTVEKSFLTGMVHHHESAIEMANIAKRRGQDPFVSRLASNIVATQEREIGQMKSIYKRLVGGQLKPDPMAHDGLGLTAEEAGMTHNAQTNKALEAANPFDRAFVDEMEPHHSGAVKMANVVLTKTKDSALRDLAQGIVDTQTREIKEMNAFRTKKYGGPVPAGAGHHSGMKDDAGSGGGMHKSH